MLTTTSKQVQQEEEEIKEEKIKERKKGFIKNQPSFKHYKHSSRKRCAKATHSSYVSADVLPARPSTPGSTSPSQEARGDASRTLKDGQNQPDKPVELHSASSRRGDAQR